MVRDIQSQKFFGHGSLNEPQREKKSRLMAALKVILWLTILSFIIAFFISIYAEDGILSVFEEIVTLKKTSALIVVRGVFFHTNYRAFYFSHSNFSTKSLKIVFRIYGDN